MVIRLVQMHFVSTKMVIHATDPRGGFLGPSGEVQWEKKQHRPHQWLDSMILMVFFNLIDSMIPWTAFYLAQLNPTQFSFCSTRWQSTWIYFLSVPVLCPNAAPSQTSKKKTTEEAGYYILPICNLCRLRITGAWPGVPVLCKCEKANNQSAQSKRGSWIPRSAELCARTEGPRQKLMLWSSA